MSLFAFIYLPAHHFVVWFADVHAPSERCWNQQFPNKCSLPLQLLQPVYHDRTGSIGTTSTLNIIHPYAKCSQILWLFNRVICGYPGQLYQTRPRGPNVLHDSCLGSLQRPFTRQISTLPPPLSSTSSAPPRNYGNYQNCTIVQSHVPCSGYGTYVTMAPKTVIFPIFVQVRTNPGPESLNWTKTKPVPRAPGSWTNPETHR